MKKALILPLALAAFPAAAQTPVSKGVYRLPYPNGVNVQMMQDHTTHSPRNRIDMRAATPAIAIVAAAAGTVRVVVDEHETACIRTPSGALSAFDTNGNGTVSNAELQAAFNATRPVIRNRNRTTILNAFTVACNNYSKSTKYCCVRSVGAIGQTCQWMGAPAGATCAAGTDGDGPNNYVWLEHPNGEWTKYTHIERGTATVASRRPAQAPTVNGQKQTLSVGMYVPAGYPLGIESDVGIAVGRHLHFEVAGIDSTAEIDAQGWLLDVDGVAGRNLRNRAPAFCQVGMFRNGETRKAVKCTDFCDFPDVVFNAEITPANSPQLMQVSNTMTSKASIGANSGLTLRAGEKITLQPGFNTANGGFFAAEIGACDAPGGTGDG